MRIFVVLLLVLSLSSCSEKQELATVLRGEAFGTTYTIQMYPSSEFEVQKGIDSVLQAVNASVNTYIPNSDISKINKGDKTVVVDAIFREVFEISEMVYRQSNGYFDPTIGVLRNAYGFGDTEALNRIEGATLDSLRNYVGFEKVAINTDGTINKQYAQIYFDFNAVAKGYGIDCLGKYLESEGVNDYLIELGGELLAKGRNIEKDKAWTVGIEALDSEVANRTYDKVLALSNEGMATSGNYRKFRIDSVTGRKFVHTINPLNGEAEESDVTSVTVIAESCALADAYATTFMAMGYEKSMELLKSLDGVEVYLTYVDAQQEPQWYATEGMQGKFLN